MTSLTALINKTFRKHGLSLRPAAATRIKEYLEPVGDVEERCKTLITHIKSKGLRSALVDLAEVEEAFQIMEAAKSEAKHDVLTYLDAFETPRFEYEPVRKTMIRSPQRRILHGNADDKASMLRDRWQLLQQRMSRHELFSAPAVSQAEPTHFEITHIEALIGRPGPKLIFGMLTQLLEGKWFVEDTNSAIEVNIANAQVTTGLFVENCMVLAQGELVDDVFYVSSLGFPPPEPRGETLLTFPQLNAFGLSMGTSEVAAQSQKLLEEHADDMIVVLSDVHLDNPRVVAQLHTLFEGFLPSRPPLFVLCGNFTSREMGYGEADAKAMQGYFAGLCDVISKFPALAENSRFMLVPGPTDPALGGKVLPASPLPLCFTQILKDKLGAQLILASNPARILYCGQELVIFRNDLLQHMRRNCVVPPSAEETSEISEHLVRTLLDQAHLCPLPQYKLPVYWRNDHALRLYPLPHALVLADSVDQYHWSYEGAECFNPGSFACDFSFVVYWPGQNKVQFSRIQ